MNSQLVRRVVLVVVIIAIAVAAIPAYHYYRYIESHVSTDDAYVDGTVALVSSRVAGTVTNVYVEDNWTGKEGRLLLTLDPRDSGVKGRRRGPGVALTKRLPPAIGGRAGSLCWRSSRSASSTSRRISRRPSSPTCAS